ncbi:MAG TPA: hypothetical protein VGX25_11265 [Actinophytocola sp.]|nr:hypothetical protein [Actinophytocola sp.]HEV2779965.1 hypothetical protein [Actinophytocola sp.]
MNTAGNAGEVRRLVARERNRFADARVHAFVPILVERSVRAHLATTGSG